MCAAAYGPTPGSARSAAATLLVGELLRARAREGLEVEPARRDRFGQGPQVRAPVARSDSVTVKRTVSCGPWPPGSGTRGRTARPPRGRARRGSRRARCTMRTVADHAQFVVQIVFTTSSKTVGLRSSRPAPDGHPGEVGVIRGDRVERRQVLVEPKHVRDLRAKPLETGPCRRSADDLELCVAAAALRDAHRPRPLAVEQGASARASRPPRRFGWAAGPRRRARRSSARRSTGSPPAPRRASARCMSF